MKSQTKDQQITTVKRHQAVRAAIASVRAEGLEPSVQAQQRLNQYVQGKISVNQLRRDTLNEVKAVNAPTVTR